MEDSQDLEASANHAATFGEVLDPRQPQQRQGKGVKKLETFVFKKRVCFLQEYKKQRLGPSFKAPVSSAAYKKPSPCRYIFQLVS